MALPSTAWWDTRPTVGSSTAGGAFDPALTGCSPATDLAATSGNTASPVASSASYTIVSGDVGAWLFVSAGTNWIPGWYQIASVAAGAATLSAAVGAAVLYKASTFYNAAAGVATVASPSGGTWTIDYSQQNGAQIADTGKTTDASGNLLDANTAVTWVGNILYLSGTGITTGRYLCKSVVAGTSATLDRSPGASGSAVVVNVGGALDSTSTTFGSSGAVGSNTVWLKNTGTQLSASSPGAMPAGAAGGKATVLAGYNALRGDLDDVRTFANFPTIQANNAAIDCLTFAQYCVARNLIASGGTGATKGSVGFYASAADVAILNCKATGFSSAGFYLPLAGPAVNVVSCWATGMLSGATAGFWCNSSANINFMDCVASANACTGFSAGGSNQALIRCISANNTGASSDGFNDANGAWTGMKFLHNIAYNNGRDGLRAVNSGTLDLAVLMNSIFVNNGGYGINSSGSNYLVAPYLLYANSNAFYGNTSGSRNQMPAGSADVTLAGDPFTNGSGGNFALNLAGAGAACKAAGYPGVFPGISSTGYLDIGAVQHQDAGGGPVGRIINIPAATVY